MINTPPGAIPGQRPMMPPGPPGPPAGPAPGQPGPPQPPPLSPQAQQFLQQMAQYKQMQQAVAAIQQENQKKQAEFAAACQCIREDGVHGFKIDIEADSTIAPDEQAEKAARTEFLGKIIPLFEQVMPIAMGNPQIAAFAKEMVLFGVRGFPVARGMEETIENAFDALGKMPPQPPPGAKAPTGKQGPSPQDVAIRSKEIDARLQINRENNAEKIFNAEQDRQADAEKLEASKEKDRTTLALQLGRAAKQDALAGARLTHIESQNASGLV